MFSGFKKANLVSMSKATTANDKNLGTKIVATTFENEIGFEEVSEERVSRKFGYFNARKSSYSMEKVNFPENTLLYMNQSYLTIKKKIFCCDFYIIGQIVGSSNPPQDISSYTLKENEVKMVRPKYDPKTGESKGLYKTSGYLLLRGSPEEFFIRTTEGEFQTLFL